MAQCLQPSEVALPLDVMPVVRAAERLPVQATVAVHWMAAGPAERLALQGTLQLYPPETHMIPLDLGVVAYPF